MTWAALIIVGFWLILAAGILVVAWVGQREGEAPHEQKALGQEAEAARPRPRHLRVVS